MWLATVCKETPSRSAICVYVQPRASRRNTSISRRVSGILSIRLFLLFRFLFDDDGDIGFAVAVDHRPQLVFHRRLPRYSAETGQSTALDRSSASARYVSWSASCSGFPSLAVHSGTPRH